MSILYAYIVTVYFAFDKVLLKNFIIITTTTTTVTSRRFGNPWVGVSANELSSNRCAYAPMRERPKLTYLMGDGLACELF